MFLCNQIISYAELMVEKENEESRKLVRNVKVWYFHASLFIIDNDQQQKIFIKSDLKKVRMDLSKSDHKDRLLNN